MRLALRDRLAAWLLDALRDREARETIAALEAFLRTGAGETLTPAAAERLLREGPDVFTREPGGDLALAPALRGDTGELRDRVRHFRSVLGRLPEPVPFDPERRGEPPGDEEIAALIGLAAALFAESLHFEVHELLEPAWGRSTGSRKVFLQGLIQVAVGLHHHSTRNLRGAAALLAEGSRKLVASPAEVEAFGLAAFRRRIVPLAEDVHRQLHEGAWRPVTCPPLDVPT